MPEKGLPDYRRYRVEAGGPFFRREGDFLVQVPRHRFGAQGQRLLPRRTPGRLRLVLLGESSAWMLGDELGVVAGQRGLQERIETVNMALGASSWELVQRRFEEALGLDADAILVLFGHNLYIAVHPLHAPRLPAAPGSRLASLALDLLDPPRFPQGMLPAGRVLALRAGLRRMARQARRRGVRLLLCTVPSNLRQPPGGTARADYQEAERLWKAGRWQEARRLFVRARDLDPERLRASTAVNEAIRSVARDEGAELLDFERLVSARGEHGVPGPELFKDGQHLRPEGLRWEAGRLLELLRL
ncbi:MAG: hypothetical protein HY926_03215 [Elusimicrobia bacterium]|nr:hypothetical protein [Elusimicrobiota bacterium]